MPRYEYKCPRCQGVVELQRKIAERDDAVTCDACAKMPGMAPQPMERVISLPAPTFPGAANWH